MPAVRLKKQLRVQLPTSADNVTLLAFADERPAAAAVDRYLLPVGPTAANPTAHAAAAIDKWDRQTDRPTPYRYADPAATAAYYASRLSGVSNSLHENIHVQRRRSHKQRDRDLF